MFHLCKSGVKYIVCFVCCSLTLEQKEVCRARTKLLQYLDKLSTYEVQALDMWLETIPGLPGLKNQIWHHCLSCRRFWEACTRQRKGLITASLKTSAPRTWWRWQWTMQGWVPAHLCTYIILCLPNSLKSEMKVTARKLSCVVIGRRLECSGHHLYLPWLSHPSAQISHTQQFSWDPVSFWVWRASPWCWVWISCLLLLSLFRRASNNLDSSQSLDRSNRCSQVNFTSAASIILQWTFSAKLQFPQNSLKYAMYSNEYAKQATVTCCHNFVSSILLFGCDHVQQCSVCARLLPILIQLLIDCVVWLPKITMMPRWVSSQTVWLLSWCCMDIDCHRTGSLMVDWGFPQGKCAQREFHSVTHQIST